MAAALIGEALISASIDVLCDRVTSAEFIDLFRQKKLDKSLLMNMNMSMTLLTFFVVLNDAEEKQIVNPTVREWLNKLKHAVFDAEDLLHEIDTEALRCKLEGEDQTYKLTNKESSTQNKKLRMGAILFSTILKSLSSSTMEEFILIVWFKGGDIPLSYLPGPYAASLPSNMVAAG